MSLASDLLGQARHLAALEKKKPKQASLRRSVSTAYYSLFHFLGEEVSRSIVGTTEADRDLRNLVRRALEHGKMKSFCIQFKPGNNLKQLLIPLAAKLQISGDLEIETLATAFCDLQEKRHEADYDHTRVITRNEALNACDQADEAMKAWRSLRVRKPEAVSFFATALLLWPSLSGR